MPKRPRSHILEDLAHGHLLELLSAVGWTVEGISKDYGEDFMVRIFDSCKPTPWAFFVQSKATDNIKKYLSKDENSISYPIKTDHLKYWKHFWEPVILTVFDASKRISYWEFIQDYLDKIEIDESVKSKIKVNIPVDNILNQEGVTRIRSKTIRRFERFKNQEEGAKILLEELKEQWNVDIIYRPLGGLLILPEGKFVADTPEAKKFIFFGRLKERIDRIQEKLGVDDPELIVEAAIKSMKQVVDAFSQDGSLVVIDQNTRKIVEKYETLDEVVQMLKRKSELEE